MDRIWTEEEKIRKKILRRFLNEIGGKKRKISKRMKKGTKT